MSKNTISKKNVIAKDVLAMLEQVADLAATKAVRKKRIQKRGIDYFYLTKKFLRDYQDLKDYISDEETYIELYCSDERPRKSKDVVMFSSAHSKGVAEFNQDLRDKAIESLEVTKKFMYRIDLALNRLSDMDRSILQDMLMEKEKADNLCEKYHYADPSGLYKKLNSTIDKVSRYLFGGATMEL